MAKKKKKKEEGSIHDTLSSLSSKTEEPEEEAELEEEPQEAEIEEETEEVEPEEEVEEDEVIYDEEIEKGIDFLELMKRINKALNSEEGRKLNCRLKVVVEGREAYIYQGLRNNVYGRIFHDKKHIIYRYPLKKLLLNHPATKPYFKPSTIRF